MFWNRHKALRLRAEQAETQRDILRQYLAIQEQELAELQLSYEKRGEDYDKLLELANALLVEYGGMLQPIELRNN